MCETQKNQNELSCYTNRVWLAISVHPDMNGWSITKMTLETCWGKY